MLKVKRLTPSARLPERGTAKSAGLDLFLDQDVLVLHPGKRGAASTGIAVAIPEGHYGRLAPRSGLAFKSGIDVLAGVIDEDYTGELKVILLNTDDKSHVYKRGEKIAQLILERITLMEVEEVEDLRDTERGSNGFGSTGSC